MPTDGGFVGPVTEEEALVQDGFAAGSVTRNLTAIPFVIGGDRAKKIPGLTFPVPPRGMTVKQAIKIDEVSIPKKSGKILQPTGYEPAEITVELEIVPEEGLNGTVITSPIERLRPLQKLFRDGRASVPVPVEIISPLTDLLGIRQVLIRELNPSDDGESNWIPVTMVLQEFESIKTQLENQGAAAEASNTAAQQGADEIAANAALDRQLGYVADEYSRGVGEGLTGVESPGADMPEPVMQPE